MNWDLATDIILYAAIAIVAIFFVFAVYQLFPENPLKVDRALIAMPLPLILMTITYFFFDKVWVLATAPGDPTKPSFPSTHVMVTATVFFVAAIALTRYLKSRPARITLDIIMLALITVTAAGRIIVQAHWVTDVIFAIVFSVIFATTYYLTIKEKHE